MLDVYCLPILSSSGIHQFAHPVRMVCQIFKTRLRTQGSPSLGKGPSLSELIVFYSFSWYIINHLLLSSDIIHLNAFCFGDPVIRG